MNCEKILSEILEECANQIYKHGYTQESDLRWKNGELGMAAAVYATPQEKRNITYWPFDLAYYKEEERRKELIKAAALIIAEIERIDAQV